MHDKVLPTSEGLLRCLQALAEEAASLGMTLTHLALQPAIDACRIEGQCSLAVASAPAANWVH